MTPEEKENALRAQARRCAEEITKAMSVKPKPKWNAVCPPHPSQALREGPAYGCQPGEICQCYWAAQRPLWSGIMKERGMIFNGEMVRAILDGRKTQTRRIMAPQPADDIERCIFSNPEAIGWKSSLRHKHGSTTAHFCHYGKPGDRIWVRETWATLGNEDGCCVDWEGNLCKGDERSAARIYRASCEQRPGDYGLWSIPDDAYWKPHTKEHKFEGAWRPSIHMPRWASRILLEITDVRVERLNAISEEDARAEGIIDGGCLNCGEPEPCGCANPEPDATDAFAYLWQSIYGQEGWNANPWVWVIEFKRVEGGAA